MTTGRRRGQRAIPAITWLLPLASLAACGAQAASATPQLTAPETVPAATIETVPPMAVGSTVPSTVPSTAPPAAAEVAVPPTSVVVASVPDTAAPVAAGSPATDIAPDEAPATIPAPTAVPAPNVRSGSNVNAVADVGDPVRVIVPSAGIDGPVSSAGVLDDGTVAVPPDPSIAGWFTGGPRPGELGPAVIVGHVDSKKAGPGVFYRLRDVKVGDTATVVTTTGSQQFVAIATELVPKDEFPTARVYGQVPVAALRLITCGGSFDSSIGHYRDNVVVYLVKVPG